MALNQGVDLPNKAELRQVLHQACNDSGAIEHHLVVCIDLDRDLLAQHGGDAAHRSQPVVAQTTAVHIALHNVAHSSLSSVLQRLVNGLLESDLGRQEDGEVGCVQYHCGLQIAKLQKVVELCRVTLQEIADRLIHERCACCGCADC